MCKKRMISIIFFLTYSIIVGVFSSCAKNEDQHSGITIAEEDSFGEISGVIETAGYKAINPEGKKVYAYPTTPPFAPLDSAIINKDNRFSFTKGSHLLNHSDEKLALYSDFNSHGILTTIDPHLSDTISAPVKEFQELWIKDDLESNLKLSFLGIEQSTVNDSILVRYLPLSANDQWTPFEIHFENEISSPLSPEELTLINRTSDLQDTSEGDTTTDNTPTPQQNSLPEDTPDSQATDLVIDISDTSLVSFKCGDSLTKRFSSPYLFITSTQEHTQGCGQNFWNNHALVSLDTLVSYEDIASIHMEISFQSDGNEVLYFGIIDTASQWRAGLGFNVTKQHSLNLITTANYPSTPTTVDIYDNLLNSDKREYILHPIADSIAVMVGPYDIAQEKTNLSGDAPVSHFSFVTRNMDIAITKLVLKFK